MHERPLLLDTHVWLWLVDGSAEVKPHVRKLVRDAAKLGNALVPAISVWEIGMLCQKNRIQLNKPVRSWVEESLDKAGFVLMPLTHSIALEATLLPGSFHNDPADCMIVATARVEGASLLTRDSRIIAYGEAGHLSTIFV